MEPVDLDINIYYSNEINAFSHRLDDGFAIC